MFNVNAHLREGSDRENEVLDNQIFRKKKKEIAGFG
jgi:hypothetical protein